MPFEQGGGTFDGRYSDGKTAAAGDIRVSFDERGLLLRLDGAAEALIWPYGALSTAEPISSHAIDALVAYSYQSGASLFVPSGAFARRLAEAAPHLTTRAARRRSATPWLVAAAAVAIVAVGISALQLSPARAIASLLPDGARKSLGDSTIKSMTAGKAVCGAAAGRIAVDKLSRRLTAAAPAGTAFEITVVDWGLVNAFATAGNRIVLTRGLIEKAESPDEVAGVLAHEMGHGIAMHPETGIVRAIGLSAAVELMLGGGGGTLSNIGLFLAQLSYTRAAEIEADELALQLLRDAGIANAGMAAFFRRIEAKGEVTKKPPDTRPGQSAGNTDGESKSPRRSGGLGDMLSTHPATHDRLRRIEASEKYPATAALPTTDWQALRAMCGTSTPAE